MRFNFNPEIDPVFIVLTVRTMSLMPHSTDNRSTRTVKRPRQQSSSSESDSEVRPC